MNIEVYCTPLDVLTMPSIANEPVQHSAIMQPTSRFSHLCSGFQTFHNTLTEHGSLYYFLKIDLSIIRMYLQSFLQTKWQRLQSSHQSKTIKEKNIYWKGPVSHAFIIPVHFDISSHWHNCIQVTSTCIWPGSFNTVDWLRRCTARPKEWLQWQFLF